MTIGYKVEPEIKDFIEKGVIHKKQMSLEMILEAPIEKERNFVILNSLQRQKDGVLTFIRKLMEI